MANILFVDDDVMVLRSIQREFHQFPHEQFYAVGANAALKILEEHAINVLVTDMRMPVMNGLELLKIVKKDYPDVVKIVLSGYTHLPQVIATINQGDIFRFVTKPWANTSDLKNAVLDAIQYAEYLASQDKHENQLEIKNAMYQNMLLKFNEKSDRLVKDIEVLKKIYMDQMSRTEALIPPEMKPTLADIINLENAIVTFMPSSYSKANYESFIKALDKTIKKTLPLLTIDYKYDDEEKTEVFINLDLIVAVLEALCVHFLSKTSFSEVKIELSGIHPFDKKEKKEKRAKQFSILIDILSVSDETLASSELFMERFESILEDYFKIKFVFSKNRMVIQFKTDYAYNPHA